MATQSVPEPHERRRCAGTSKQTGQRCGLAPAPGATVCKWHGAGAPQVKAAAARRLAEAEIEAHLVTLGAPVDTTPEEALQRQLQITAGHVAWLLRRVQELEPDALTWGVTSEHTVQASQFPGIDTTREAVPHALLAAYERWLKIHQGWVDMALKHDLGARMVRIAERDALRVADALRGILGDLHALLVAGRLRSLELSDPAVMRVVSDRLSALAVA